MNAYEFAKTLSPARSRAFLKANREIEIRARGEKWAELSRKTEEIRVAFILEHMQEIDAIRENTRQRAQEIQAQINALHLEMDKVREEGREAEMKISVQAYRTPEYKEAEALASAEWHKDQAVYLEKLEALMAKYEQAQKASA